MDRNGMTNDGFLNSPGVVMNWYINKYNLNIPVFGMVKDDKHNTKMLIDENRKQIYNGAIIDKFFIISLVIENHKVYDYVVKNKASKGRYIDFT